MARVLGGRYRLVEHLGNGGMSVVWRAHDEVLGRSVAVKVLPPGHISDAGSRARIRAEARQAARLAHPYIMSVHDYGESPLGDDECVPFVVMELVDGPTLADRLAEGPVPAADALRICAQVAAALAAAHARGVVHRDIKPANIILSASGAKVLDFGISALAGEQDSIPAGGEVWGTPAYLAPERLEGGTVLPASDVYALGLLLYRLLTGALPWRAETVTQMIDAHLYVEPPPLPRLPGVHDSVREICSRCLDKDPAGRPAAGAVARLLAAATGRHSRPAPAGRPARGTDPRAETRVATAGRPSDPPPVEERAEESSPAPAAGAAVAARGGGAGSSAAGAAAGGVAGSPAAGAAVNAWGDGAGSPAAGAAVTAPAEAAGAAAPGPRAGVRERRTARTGAAILLAIGLVAGFCVASDRPIDRPRPVRPAAAAPSGQATVPGGTDDVGARAEPSGTGAPNLPIQSDVVGGNPGVDGTGGRGATGSAQGNGATPGPAPVERVVDMVGGTVTVRCVGPTAEIVGWDLGAGFVPILVERGPGPEVGLTLDGVVTGVRLVVRCRDGVPVASIG